MNEIFNTIAEYPFEAAWVAAHIIALTGMYIMTSWRGYAIWINNFSCSGAFASLNLWIPILYTLSFIRNYQNTRIIQPWVRLIFKKSSLFSVILPRSWFWKRSNGTVQSVIADIWFRLRKLENLTGPENIVESVTHGLAHGPRLLNNTELSYNILTSVPERRFKSWFGLRAETVPDFMPFFYYVLIPSWKSQACQILW